MNLGLHEIELIAVNHISNNIITWQMTVDWVSIGSRIYWTRKQLVTSNNYDSLTELRTPKITVTAALPLGSGTITSLRIQLLISHNCTYQLTQLNIKVKVKVTLYDWRFTANQFVLAPSPLGYTIRDFLWQLNPCGPSPYVTFSLTRGWGCLLWISLAFCQVYVLHV
jgi:hypothetical protein